MKDIEFDSKKEEIINDSQGLEYTLTDNGKAYSVSQGYADSKLIEIPCLFNNLPVKYIEDDGFMFSDINKIIIPKSITGIGTKAFQYCDNLRDITFNGKITYIGKRAFSYCENLCRINFGESVGSIGDFAFENCKSLSSIKLFKRVGSIGDSVFAGCWRLKFIDFTESVEEIGDRVFEDCINLEYLDIPEGIAKLDNSIFKGCEKLRNIYLPSSLEDIGERTFIDCSNLNRIIIHPKNRKYKIDRNCLIHIPDSRLVHTFQSITIPNGVKIIGNSVFQDRRDLLRIVVPESVVEIGDNSFSHCTGLKSINIPSRVTNIGNYAFSVCQHLEKVYIPKSVASIGEGVFANCSHLTIFVESEHQPVEWRDGWNCDRPIVWGVTKEDKLKHNLTLSSKDVSDIVMDTFIQSLEKDEIPWKKPWAGGAYNVYNATRYRGYNKLFLKKGGFLTKRQATLLGGKVNENAKPRYIIFFEHPVWKSYEIYSIDECEGVRIPARTQKLLEAMKNEIKPIEELSKYIEEYSKKVKLQIVYEFGIDRACYSEIFDKITLPELCQFNTSNEYYSTLFHETVHSTKHHSRLDRDIEPNNVKDIYTLLNVLYSAEELVAEIGASMLMYNFQIDTIDTVENNSAYINGWIKWLRENLNLLPDIIKAAEKAYDYILKNMGIKLDEYTWTYNKLIKQLTDKYENFKEDQRFYDILKSLQQLNKYYGINPVKRVKKNAQPQKYYNPEIVKEFGRYYTKKKQTKRAKKIDDAPHTEKQINLFNYDNS